MRMIIIYYDHTKEINEQNKTKITLEEKLQAYKLTGYVQANAITALAGSVTDNDEVNFKITDDKVGKSVTELLEKFGCLKGMTKSNQLSLFI